MESKLADRQVAMPVRPLSCMKHVRVKDGQAIRVAQFTESSPSSPAGSTQPRVRSFKMRLASSLLS